MTNEEAMAFLDNLMICVNEHPIVADWLVEIANRKTKTKTSEIIEAYTKGYEDGAEAVKQTFVADGIVFEKKDEPQTMYYPQVDGITPSVIKPQTERSK